MATTNTAKITVRKFIRREQFPSETIQVWKCNKIYSWGVGWRLVGKCETLGDENLISLRLDVKNQDEHTPIVGEEWEVLVKNWRHAEGDLDPDEKFIVYIEGFLKQKVIPVKKAPKRQKKWSPPKQTDTITKDIATDIIPFRDPNNELRILYMEITLVNGRVTKKKLHRIGTLDGYIAFQTKNLRELINSVLENPCYGIKNTDGIIEKYIDGPLEDIVVLPPFLTA